jgi:hypothetical protein
VHSHDFGFNVKVFAPLFSKSGWGLGRSPKLDCCKLNTELPLQSVLPVIKWVNGGEEMSNVFEIQVKQSLFELMLLEKRNEKLGIKVVGLGQLIRKTKAGMTKEEIAYVKELVDEENEF